MNDTHPIFVALKKQLKARKVSYAELGKRMKMSEANVKRIFSEESCSLARLGQICDVIQISFSDLVRASTELEPEFFVLEKSTEAFFADNLDYFLFFRQMEHGKSLKEMQDHHGLSLKELNRYAKKIEELGLIERMPGDKVRIVPKGYLQLGKESRLLKEYFRRWVPHFFERVMVPGPQHFMKVFSTGLTERNRKELVKDLEAVMVKYQERGYFDQSRGSEPFEDIGVCFGVGPYRVGEGKIADYKR